MGCLVLVDDADKNNRLDGDDDGRSGETLPVSLSLDVEDGGVGGSENPGEKTKQIRPAIYNSSSFT